MSILNTLKLTAASPANSAQSEFSFREKMLRYLEEQKALAEAEIAGTQFAATRMVTRKNEAGQKVRVEEPRHVRRGWFTDTKGKTYFQLRYGSSPIDLAKGMNAIEIEGLADVPVIVGKLIEATNGGELDSQLTAARDARRANFNGKAKK